ncbi:hypothetical protein PGTUg99_003715 [Puccinia graminis f. sp. tritici]|uniref:Uncharacterized protein n=1 Tax=Puccinia graminis f. sp. tritici TaxID=56615 RepID=A0A5B0RAW7_PUCGR|nr:hypothetical protein PGTUg99_003715 [Puccinia graminis f. sp. tritici]
MIQLQVVIVQLFDNFEDRLYSPKLYESLGVTVKEFQEASKMISRPMGDILQALESIRFWILVEDPSWPEVQRLLAKLLGSTLTNSKEVAWYVTGAVAKAAFEPRQHSIPWSSI